MVKKLTTFEDFADFKIYRLSKSTENKNVLKTSLGFKSKKFIRKLQKFLMFL